MRPPLPSERDPLKRAAAARAVTEVEDGMILGLGSGSTAAFAIEALAARIAKDLRAVGILASETTAALARRFGVPLRMIDDKLGMKQGYYARDPQILAGCQPADIQLDRISELNKFALAAFMTTSGRRNHAGNKSTV